MKRKNFSQNQNQEPASASRPTAAADLNQSGIDFAPSADEVARRAYFSYVNQSSLPGHEVQHWLAAEAELLTERNPSGFALFMAGHEIEFPGNQP